MDVNEQPKLQILEDVTNKNRHLMEHIDQFISLHQEWFILFYDLYMLIIED